MVGWYICYKPSKVGDLFLGLPHLQNKVNTKGRAKACLEDSNRLVCVTTFFLRDRIATKRHC